MNRILLIVWILILSGSCSRRNEKPDLPTVEKGDELIARDIIYDVIIKPQSEDDEWEREKLQGYDGAAMIDRIFEAIYSGTVIAYDYHTGEKLTPRDIRNMEKQEGLTRDNIGKIQFTENWYFNPENLQIEKEIISIVPGYESRSSDGMFIGYRAAFRLDIKSFKGSY
jgi:hypothetical protein